jgi:hypothetical protein
MSLVHSLQAKVSVEVGQIYSIARGPLCFVQYWFMTDIPSYFGFTMTHIVILRAMAELVFVYLYLLSCDIVDVAFSMLGN